MIKNRNLEIIGCVRKKYEEIDQEKSSTTQKMNKINKKIKKEYMDKLLSDINDKL